MQCTTCGRDNRSGRRFCADCGNRLALACSNCGSENEPDEKFCGQCGVEIRELAVRGSGPGEAPPTPDPLASHLATNRASYTPKHLAEKILTSRAALEGERKQVTVLFADVKGSMELAEQLDPEEWHKILDRFFQILAEGVHRFEGTVNQYTGDGIMALFGAPIAHEDHAQRACYAALSLTEALRAYAREVRREHGLDFAFRMGLNSGEVVVGKIGDDLRMDYTAQGHCVGLAQRMESLAEANSCFVSDATATLVRGYIQLEDLGGFRVKGASEPIRVHRLGAIGEARTRFDLSKARGLVRFVGRDGEMQLLEAALERARSGNGQVIGVVADAGTGKSRLCFEFVERCRGLGLRVIEGQAVAHGKNVPFLPVLQVIRAYYGIAAEDDERTAREKIAGRMLLLDESYRDVLPLLFDFLGVPDSDNPTPPLPPETRQRRLFAVLHRLIQGGPQPGNEIGVALIEDLHWLDGASEAWLGEWVRATAGARNLLLVNFRPEYRAEWMQQPHYQQVSLAPLSSEAIGELLHDLIGNDPSTAALGARIHTHTAGNPFFAEEVVQSLIESGQLVGSRGAYRSIMPIEDLIVPATVQAILAARIDRLPEREKLVLQVASVIGKDFDLPLLTELSELSEADLQDVLAVLRAGEFVHERALFPVAEYGFKHPLTQAVTEASLLRARRRELHAAVARALEARAGDLDERAALLAHHWEEAGEQLCAARWHLRAADSIGAKDVHETARHARAVIDLLRPHEQLEEAPALLGQACARLMNLGWRIGLAAEAAEIFANGRRWARAGNDLDAEARLAGAYAAVICLDGRLDEGMAAATEFIDLAERTGDPEMMAVARGWSTYPLRCLGKLREAETHLLALISEGERRPDLGMRFLGARLTALLLNWLIESQRLTRSCVELEKTIERARQWNRDRGDLENDCFLTNNRAIVAIRYTGNADRGQTLARQALVQAEELGSPIALALAKRTLAECCTAAGLHDAAMQFSQEAHAEIRSRRILLNDEGTFLAILAEARLGGGDIEGAGANAREAVTIAQRMHARTTLPDALHTLARVLLADGALDEAASVLDQMEIETKEIGAVNLVPMILWRQADLAAARGEHTERARFLRQAHALLLERGTVGHVERVAQQLRA